MPGKDDLENFLDNIKRCLKMYSVQELNEAIQESLSRRSDKWEEVNHVFEVTAKIHATTVRHIKVGQSHKCSEIRKIVYCILYFDLGFTNRVISRTIFHSKHHGSVFQATKKFKNLNDNIKQDREFKQKYQLVLASLMDFMKTKEANLKTTTTTGRQVADNLEQLEQEEQ